MLTHNGQVNTLRVSVDCHVVKKINPKPFKERSQENEMLQKTNTKISAPSLKSVWCIVTKLFAETCHLILKSFIWRRSCLFTELGFRVGFRVGFSS